MKYLTLTISVLFLLAPSLGWSEQECLGDQLLQKVDDSNQESADTTQLRTVREYNEAHFEKYKSYLAPKPSEDRNPEFPALLDAVKDENGKTLAAIPSLQVIEMLNHVDFHEVGKTVNVHNLYLKTFDMYVSDSQVIGLSNVYLAGKFLAHTGDVPPTAQQIYDAIKNAELKGAWPGPRPQQAWHLHPDNAH